MFRQACWYDRFIMLWILLASLMTTSESFKSVLTKVYVRSRNPLIVALGLRFFTALIFTLVVLLTGSLLVEPEFWPALLTGGLLNTATTLLYMTALKRTDLSLAVPMLAFTPLFLLITSPILVGEVPSLAGLAGVVLIVVGSYVLQITRKDEGFLEPIRALARNKGMRLMLLVAFLWSITSNIDKIGVEASSPVTWIFAMNIFIAALLGLIFLVRRPVVLRAPSGSMSLIKDAGRLAPLGLVEATTLFFQMSALSLTLVSYVIAFKRISILLAVVWGRIFFSETGFSERLGGAALMTTGVLLIIFGG